MFFESKEHAELHEAEMRLTASALRIQIDPQAFMDAINACHQEVQHYLTARRKIGPDAESSFPATPYSGASYDGGREEDAPRKLKQSSRKRELVPDVRSGELAEAVADQEPSDGTGSGEHDAPSVLGGEDMATDAYPEIRKTRLVGGEQDIRPEKVAEVPKDV